MNEVISNVEGLKRSSDKDTGSIPADMSINEIIENIREFGNRLKNGELNEHEASMTRAALEQNLLWLSRYNPQNLGEVLDKYFTTLGFKLPTFENIDVSNLVGALFSKMPPVPFLKPDSIFNTLPKLKLDIPRNLITMFINDKQKFFSIGDISTSFKEYLSHDNKNLFLMTEPIYEQQTDNNTLLPNKTPRERIREIGKNEEFVDRDVFKLTITQNFKRSGDKLYVPLGIIYADDVENDYMSLVIPSYIKLTTKDGDNIILDKMTIVQNGQLFVKCDPSHKIESIKIKYSSVRTTVSKYLNITSDQSTHVGLGKETAKTHIEEKIKQNLSLYSDGETKKFNKLLKYLQTEFLRYSELDTIKKNNNKNDPNALRALREKRTACLGASNIAKFLIDSVNFSNVLATKSGILCGCMLNSEEIAGIEDEELYSVTGENYHAVTLFQGKNTRIYDITPEIKYKKPSTEDYLDKLWEGTNAVYRAVKNAFINSKNKHDFNQYREVRDHNLRLLDARNQIHEKFEGNLLFRQFIYKASERIIETSLKGALGLPSNAKYDITKLLGFPFSLKISKRDIHYQYEDKELAATAKNTKPNIQLLKHYGINLKPSGILRRGLPIFQNDIEILESIYKLQKRTPEMMSFLIERQKNLTELFERINGFSNIYDITNDILRSKLLKANISIDDEAFNSISWLGALFSENDSYYSSLIDGETMAFLNKNLPAEVKVKYLDNKIQSIFIQYNIFLNNNFEEIKKLFEDPTHNQSNIKNLIVSSSYLWKQVHPERKLLSQHAQKVKKYLHIQKKMGAIFENFYIQKEHEINLLNET